MDEDFSFNRLFLCFPLVLPNDINEKVDDFFERISPEKISNIKSVERTDKHVYKLITEEKKGAFHIGELDTIHLVINDPSHADIENLNSALNDIVGLLKSVLEIDKIETEDGTLRLEIESDSDLEKYLSKLISEEDRKGFRENLNSDITGLQFKPLTDTIDRFSIEKEDDNLVGVCGKKYDTKIEYEEDFLESEIENVIEFYESKLKEVLEYEP